MNTRRSKLLIEVEVEHEEGDGDLRGDFVADAVNQLARDVFKKPHQVVSAKWDLRLEDELRHDAARRELKRRRDEAALYDEPEKETLYYEEPDSCYNCGSISDMELRDVSWNDKPARAWMCHVCGFSHLSEFL